MIDSILKSLGLQRIQKRSGVCDELQIKVTADTSDAITNIEKLNELVRNTTDSIEELKNASVILHKKEE